MLHHLHEVIPTQSETKCWIDKSCAVTGKALFVRQVCLGCRANLSMDHVELKPDTYTHLAQSHHDLKDARSTS
jgi:hypothetical protein